MQVFILYANPVATSFGAALHTQVVTTLRARGHEIDDCDLYVEPFDPVMSEQERVEYHDTTISKPRVAAFADRLLSADALVLVYPIWNEGFPAILKGFFDRVFITGMSSENGPERCRDAEPSEAEEARGGLYVCADRVTTFLSGDPPRRVVKRLVRSMPGQAIRCDYLAHYDMNRTTPERRGGFPQESEAGL